MSGKNVQYSDKVRTFFFFISIVDIQTKKCTSIRTRMLVRPLVGVVENLRHFQMFVVGPVKLLTAPSFLNVGLRN